MPKLYTLEQFLIDTWEIHGKKGRIYDYNKVSLTKKSDIVIIICPKHGEFKQRVSVHINDECGCPKCGKERQGLHRKTLNEIIQAANKVHGDLYDYGDSDYIDMHTNIKIYCKKHKKYFYMRPDAHIYQKQGCPECGIEKRKSPLQKTTDKFIKQAQIKWGNLEKYNYDITEYKNKITKIKYICKIHGIVEQYPTLHLKHGCPFCAGRGVGKHTNETFLSKAELKHGKDRYSYPNLSFKSVFDKINIICKICGFEFKQPAYRHLNGNGCPHCACSISTSKAEKEIREFIGQQYKIITNDRELLNGKEIDIYLPDLKLGIEYHGLWYHCESKGGKIKYHFDKANIASEKNIKLIQVYENEWQYKKEIVKSRINSFLGRNKRIYAKETNVVELNTLDKNNFLSRTHIQGSDISSIRFGLMYQENIVAVMTFNKPRFNNNQYNFELLRYASELNTNVVGGASKLLKHFLKLYPNCSIVSFADRRWSNGNLYEKLGFELKSITNPGYVYFNLSNKNIFNRIKFQKHKLKNMPYYDPDLSEYKIMRLNGYDRIWDAGHLKYVLNK